MKPKDTIKQVINPYDAKFKKSFKKYYTKKVIDTINELKNPPIDLLMVSLEIPPTFDHLGFYSFKGIEHIINTLFDNRDSSFIRELQQSSVFLIPKFVTDSFYTYPKLILTMVILSRTLCPYSKFLIEKKLATRSFYKEIVMGNFFEHSITTNEQVWDLVDSVRDFEDIPNLNRFMEINDRRLNIEELYKIPYIPILEVDILDYGGDKIARIPRFDDYLEIIQ